MPYELNANIKIMTNAYFMKFAIIFIPIQINIHYRYLMLLI